MDRRQWSIVVDTIESVARRLPRPKRRVLYSDQLIARMYFWSVAHDRPLMWACRRENYSSLFRPRRLPSVSQFCRRVSSERMKVLLQKVHDRLAGSPAAGDLSYIDGKPLVVSGVSKDKDARSGYAAGGWAKGYKLHAWAGQDGRIGVWCVLPLNVHEMKVAEAMLPHAPMLGHWSLTLVDGNYDAADLHKAIEARDGRLLATPRGFAKHPVTRRQMGRARRESLAAWEKTPSLCRMVHASRTHIERIFSNLCATSGGLTHLPPWVRTRGRVRRYVGAKIILYHARLQARRTGEGHAA